MSFGLRDGTAGNTNFQTFTDTNTTDLSNSLQIPDAAAANTWYNIVESYDAVTKVLTIYLNGAERGTMSLGAQTFISANALRIGTFRSANDRWFNGSIDEFAIWNRALSAGEATGLHQLGTNGETLTTVKYTVSLTASPSAGGSVTGGGLYNASASVPISATPTPGYVFTSWDGDFTGQPASFTYTANADATAGATFAEDMADPDNDGLTNFQEGAIYQTNPNNADTDGDEIPDGVEITIGTAPKISDAALVALVRSHLSTGSAGGIALTTPSIVRDPTTGAIYLNLKLKGSADKTTWQDVTPSSIVPASDGWNVTITAPSNTVNSYILKGN